LYGYDTARTPGVLPTLQIQEIAANQYPFRRIDDDRGPFTRDRAKYSFAESQFPFTSGYKRPSRNKHNASYNNNQSPWSGIQGNYGVFPDRRSNSNSPAHAVDVVESFIVTAYSPTGNKTATGTTPTEGKTVAADFSVIPKGSLIEIEGVGQRTVEDTGGAMEGPILDLFMYSEKECIKFGRKTLKVKIIRRGY